MTTQQKIEPRIQATYTEGNLPDLKFDAQGQILVFLCECHDTKCTHKISNEEAFKLLKDKDIRIVNL